MKSYLLYFLIVLGFIAVQPAWALVTINTVSSDGKVSAFYLADPNDNGSLVKVATASVGRPCRRLVLADPMGNGVNDIYVAADHSLIRAYPDPGFPGNFLHTFILDTNDPNLDGVAIDAGDVDNNGKVDIVFGSSVQVVKFEWNDPNWIMTMVKPPAGEAISAVAVGDSDENGTNEIIAYYALGGHIDKMEWDGSSYTGTGYGVNWIPGNLIGYQTRYCDADWNGDGKKDYVLATFPYTYRYDYQYGSSGTSQLVHNNALNNTSIACGNLDGDAYPDIVTVGTKGTIEGFEWVNGSKVGRVVEAWSEGNLQGVVLYDIDSDGLDEIIAVNWGGDIIRYDYNPSDPNNFDKAILWTGGELFKDVAIGDIGLKCTELLPGDFDKNCRIDMADFAYFAGDWLKCTDTTNPECNQ